MSEIKPGQIWKNNKRGGTYRVIGVGKHSETLEDLVFYEPLYENKVAKFWARPLSMWEEIIEIDGENKPRFELISE